MRRHIILLAFALCCLCGCSPKSGPVNPVDPPVINPDEKPSVKEGDGKTTTAVYGQVTDASTGESLPGVLVSDGVQIVKTDEKGWYVLTADLGVAKNVFVIMPAKYDFTANKYGGWSNFHSISKGLKKQEYDFKLTPRSSNTDKARFLLLGDPQQMSSRAHSGESWKYVCNAIKAYRSGVDVPLYQISLGDMVTNEIEVSGKAEAYLDVQKTAGVTTFSVPGNHDHVQKASTYYDSVSEFAKWFGPYNYAFNIAGVHFVFLDSCAWCEGSSTYGEFLNDEAINFLEKDLSFVDKDTPVHIFTHCPLTKKHGGTIPTPDRNHSRFLAALSGRDVNMWYGHIHFAVNYSYTATEISSRASGLKSLESHIVARCGGCWSCSGEVCRDGSPRGFVELDINGKEAHWQFHSIDSNYDSTMNTYVPGQFDGEGLTGVKTNALYCNVYQWDNLWSTPEVWINGTKAATMTKSRNGSYDASYDPMYSHFYPIWKNQGKMAQRDEPAAAYDNSHLFEYIPASGVGSVEIRVTDRWGKQYSKQVKW